MTNGRGVRVWLRYSFLETGAAKLQSVFASTGWLFGWGVILTYTQLIEVPVMVLLLLGM